MRFVFASLALIPAVVGFVATGVWPELGDAPWPVMAVAGVLAIAAIGWRRRQIVLILIAFGLATVSAQAATTSRAVFDVSAQLAADESWPFFDLTRDSLPESPPAYVSVQGFYRAGWTLDEYGVEPGKIPDQSKNANAVLVPLVPSREGALTPNELLVVARVASSTNLDDPTAVIVRGKIRPLDPAILETLVQAAPTVDPSALRGVIVDTLSTPQPRTAWSNLGVALVSALIGVACLWFAAPSAGREATS